MKRLIFASICTVLTVGAFAQKNVSLGPVAGFGHSWIKGGEGDNKYKPSGNFGVQIVYSATENFGIGGDLQYSIEGAKRELGGEDFTTRLNYLRIPVKAIYFFGDFGDKVRPKVSLGPSVGFLMGAKQEMDGGSDIDVKDEFKKMDIGVHANAGLHYNIVTNTWLTFDLNYYNGLMDISEISGDHKNRNLGLNVGVIFGIAKHEE